VTVVLEISPAGGGIGRAALALSAFHDTDSSRQAVPSRNGGPKSQETWRRWLNEVFERGRFWR